MPMNILYRTDMKRFKIITLSAVLAISLLCGCGSKPKVSRNPDYIYGEIPNGGIETIYPLTGEKTQTGYEALEPDKSGVAKNFFISVSDTVSGGVVAYGKGLYVYSPDKNDRDGVTNELVTECLSSKE